MDNYDNVHIFFFWMVIDEVKLIVYIELSHKEPDKESLNMNMEKSRLLPSVYVNLKIYNKTWEPFYLYANIYPIYFTQKSI